MEYPGKSWSILKLLSGAKITEWGNDPIHNYRPIIPVPRSLLIKHQWDRGQQTYHQMEVSWNGATPIIIIHILVIYSPMHFVSQKTPGSPFVNFPHLGGVHLQLQELHQSGTTQLSHHPGGTTRPDLGFGDAIMGRCPARGSSLIRDMDKQFDKFFGRKLKLMIQGKTKHGFFSIEQKPRSQLLAEPCKSNLG